MPLRKLSLGFRALTLQGDILAASDDINETHLINWRTDEYAVLWGTNEPSEHNFQVCHVLHSYNDSHLSVVCSTIAASRSRSHHTA